MFYEYQGRYWHDIASPYAQPRAITARLAAGIGKLYRTRLESMAALWDEDKKRLLDNSKKGGVAEGLPEVIHRSKERTEKKQREARRRREEELRRMQEERRRMQEQNKVGCVCM